MRRLSERKFNYIFQMRHSNDDKGKKEKYRKKISPEKNEHFYTIQFSPL